MALEGWDSLNAHATYDRARTLADRIRGRTGDIFRSLWGLWMGAHSAGQHAKAGPLLDEMYELLKKTDEAEYVVQAYTPPDRKYMPGELSAQGTTLASASQHTG